MAAVGSQGAEGGTSRHGEDVIPCAVGMQVGIEKQGTELTTLAERCFRPQSMQCLSSSLARWLSCLFLARAAGPVAVDKQRATETQG